MFESGDRISLRWASMGGERRSAASSSCCKGLATFNLSFLAPIALVGAQTEIPLVLGAIELALGTAIALFSPLIDIGLDPDLVGDEEAVRLSTDALAVEVVDLLEEAVLTVLSLLVIVF